MEELEDEVSWSCRGSFDLLTEICVSVWRMSFVGKQAYQVLVEL